MGENRLPLAGKGEIMASDISLAVGDGARRMTYTELAESRRISVSSAERLVRRKHWRRQVGNDGIVRILVPLDDTENPKERADPDNGGSVRMTRSAVRTGDDVRGTLRTLETAVRTLGEQLEVANTALFSERQRVDALQIGLTEERRRVEDGRKRIDELQQRVDELHTALADAVTAERIAAGEAAALRTIVDGLRARPWWRRWLR
jgi:hypothetical protein